MYDPKKTMYDKDGGTSAPIDHSGIDRVEPATGYGTDPKKSARGGMASKPADGSPKGMSYSGTSSATMSDKY